MNTTGNRRQVELLGSSVSSAMRCPSSKRSVCQSKRRVRAVSTTARPIRRGPGAPENNRRSAGPNFPAGSSQAAFLSGLGEVRLAISWAPRLVYGRIEEAQKHCFSGSVSSIESRFWNSRKLSRHSL
jgi:hypothetical protein